jgi:hypothetical protein
MTIEQETKGGATQKKETERSDFFLDLLLINGLELRISLKPFSHQSIWKIE